MQVWALVTLNFDRFLPFSIGLDSQLVCIFCPVFREIPSKLWPVACPQIFIGKKHFRDLSLRFWLITLKRSTVAYHMPYNKSLQIEQAFQWYQLWSNPMHVRWVTSDSRFRHLTFWWPCKWGQGQMWCEIWKGRLQPLCVPIFIWIPPRMWSVGSLKRAWWPTNIVHYKKRNWSTYFEISLEVTREENLKR